MVQNFSKDNLHLSFQNSWGQFVGIVSKLVHFTCFDEKPNIMQIFERLDLRCGIYLLFKQPYIFKGNIWTSRYYVMHRNWKSIHSFQFKFLNPLCSFLLAGEIDWLMGFYAKVLKILVLLLSRIEQAVKKVKFQFFTLRLLALVHTNI